MTKHLLTKSVTRKLLQVLSMACHAILKTWLRESDKKLGLRPLFLSWLRHDGHDFNIAWQYIIKTHCSMSPITMSTILFDKNLLIIINIILWSAVEQFHSHNRRWCINHYHMKVVCAAYVHIIDTCILCS